MARGKPVHGLLHIPSLIRLVIVGGSFLVAAVAVLAGLRIARCHQFRGRRNRPRLDCRAGGYLSDRRNPAVHALLSTGYKPGGFAVSTQKLTLKGETPLVIAGGSAMKPLVERSARTQILRRSR